MVNQKAINRWTAKVVPAVLIGIAAYASWVVVSQVCVNYLLNPSPTARRNARAGPAIAILVIYFLLLFFVAITYFRILYTMVYNPGYVERGPQYYEANKNSKSAKRGSTEKRTGESSYPASYAYSGTILGARPNPTSYQPELAKFYEKDVFVCEGDGRPQWCTTCMNWKPDRTHHCREVARCVRKMDHFCPWVGGIVSETNYKFFTQFTFYTAVYCLFTLTFLAIFIAETQQSPDGLNPHFIVTIAFAGLFGLFTVGMTGISLEYAFLNTTSVETLSRKVKVWSLAVYLPNPPAPGTANSFQTITYPLHIPEPGSRHPHPRTFAILHSKAGQNPFDLGWRENFKSVMGSSLADIFLPLKYSPCCDHSSGECSFALGPEFQRMKEAAGLAGPKSSTSGRRRRRRKSRRRTGVESRTDAHEADRAEEAAGSDQATANRQSAANVSQ